MKSKATAKRVGIIGALASVTMLILVLNAPGTNARGTRHSRTLHPATTTRLRNAPSDCNIGMTLRIHDSPLIHDLMTSAVSIAERL